MASPELVPELSMASPELTGTHRNSVGSQGSPELRSGEADCKRAGFWGSPAWCNHVKRPRARPAPQAAQPPTGAIDLADPKKNDPLGLCKLGGGDAYRVRPGGQAAQSRKGPKGWAAMSYSPTG